MSLLKGVLLVVVSNLMSLDKAIQYGKEYRKPYIGAASWDSGCRNNNRCSYCRGNRTHSNKRRECQAIEESLDWFDSCSEESSLENN